MAQNFNCSDLRAYFESTLIIFFMLSKALQSILRRYFGEFITGLENVQLTFWSGKINIQNASFKHDKINQLLKLHNIPLSIKLSFLGNLQIDIPWNKLTSAPVQIKVSNVMIVLKLQKVMASFQEVDDLSQNAKLLLIKNYFSYLLKKSQEVKAEKEQESGFLKKLFVKILHNLNLQVNNIHIRIENNNNMIVQSNEEDEFVDCKSESQIENLGFSLGFCIESIEAQTINANNVKEFVKIQNEKTEIRKKINLKQISLYWEENTQVNLFELHQERKIEFLRKIIDRKQHRLLTIDGQILMERGKNISGYFFSTSFRLLQIGLTFDQLKQFIEVYQQFMNAKAKKKITKMKEIGYPLQLSLEADFKSLFKRLEKSNFTEVDKKDIQLLECLDKKLLMRWTKEETIESIKRSKMKEAYQNKNKKSWLGFLSKNVENELTQEEITMIENQVNKFVKMVDEESFGKTIGFYVHFQLLRLVMDHHRVQQQLLFSAQNIEVQFQGKKGQIKASLEIADVALTYSDINKNSQVNIFKNQRQDSQKYFSLRVQDSSKKQKVDISVAAMRFIHEIQFLSFLAELIKLRERERIKGEMVLINPELTVKNINSNKQIQEVKIYECNISLKRLQVLIQLSKNANMHAYIQGIHIQKAEEVNSHKARIVNFGIAFHQKDIQGNKSYKILDDMNIEVSIRNGLMIVQSNIPLLRLTLNEESLYYIVHCMRDQYSILKIRSVQSKNEVIAEEKFMEGETSTISVFKAVNIYHSILTSDYLYFYEKDNGKINYEKMMKKLLLRNMKVSRIDNNTFKLESVLVNEIVTCKDKEEADKWIYQIQQRIFQNSTKMQMFNMMDQDGEEGAPVIYIPYDSLIEMQVKKIQVVYEKNTEEKILGVELNKLKVSLKENNLQFQRKIDLDEIKLIDLSLVDQKREQYNLILSNTHNYFQDPDEDVIRANIEVLIQGKKKTHPKYTGEVVIKSKINKLFINFNAEFFYSILYRLVVGQRKERYYSQETKFTKIFEYLKEILQEKNGIDEKYAVAKDFQYDRSYFQLEKYRQVYSCLVLFHVELVCEEVEIFFLNGRNYHWLDKFVGDGISIDIDKSTDYVFIKGSAKRITLQDVTGYPKTTHYPFTQLEPYPIIKPLKNRKFKNMVDFSVGVFESMAFINKQRFKNYFMLNLFDAEINYQQQPLLRFVDYLTNQIILFILEPFSLHKYDSPHRGHFDFGAVNFTEQEVKKILFQCVYPCFTHLNINANNLFVNFNSHPHDQAIGLSIARVTLCSVPELNPQKIHVRLDEFKRFQNKYPILRETLGSQLDFQRKVNKSQWITRYLITAQGCRCEIIENDFNYEMYFQRSNNGDKDILLPFLLIQKDLLMEGRIKNLSINAPKKVYNLINKCFMFNLTYDQQCDQFFNTNHQFQHLNIPSKLIYRLFVNELSIVIPQIAKTVIIIQNCEYKFLKYEDTRKEMEVNGRSMHILGADENLMTPLNIDQQRQRGLEYAIMMKPSGQKKMTAFLRYVDFHYVEEVIFPLFKYFLLDDSCYPKQDVYTDIPLIVCEVYLLSSYIKLLQNTEHIFALKGDIKVIWTRYQQPHPQNYKIDKQFYPKDKDGSAYDIEFKGVTLRKYNKRTYMNISAIKEGSFYRSLSSSMVFNVTLTNVMKINNEFTYTDMVGTYDINTLCLKLSYKDYQEIVGSFRKQEPKPNADVAAVAVQNAELGYSPHSKHKVTIGKLSLQFGLSQLPVPLIDLCLERSQIDIELFGKTNVLTSKIDFCINYWNMMIGKWQPLIEKSTSQLTLKAGQFQKYLMATSSRPLYLNFSVQSLKVLKLISKDISEEGNLHVINKQQRAKGIQISPYVITNRTGYSIIIHSDFTLTAKLRNNEKMHLQNRSLELDQSFSNVNYQIEGDSCLYDLSLNNNLIHKPLVTFNDQKYRLIISAIATPVLKEIIISSPYVIHNKTKYALILTVGQKDYQVDSEAKVPIPFTEEILDNRSIHLQFPHLHRVSENFSFEFKDIYRTYEHYIIYENYQTFNCLISLQSLHENVITISPLIAFINLLPLDIKMELALTKINKEKSVLYDAIEVNKEKLFYGFGSKDEVSMRIHIKGFNYSQFIPVNLTNDKQKKQLDNDIVFVDCRGLQASIKSKIVKKNKQKYIYIYADSVLINETQYKFYIFNQTQLLAGQRLKDIIQSDSKYVFLGGLQYPSLCFSEEDPSQSTRLTTKVLGDQVIKVNNYNLLYEMVINNSMNCLCEEAKIFTSIMKVTPRFILVNKCTRELGFQQFNTDQRFFLPVQERKDWYWHHNQEVRLITITAVDSEFELPNGWDYSAPLSLENLEETVLVIRPKDRTADRLLIKTEIFKQNQQIFYVFKELIQKEDSLIKIQNNVKLVNLQVYQQALNNTNQVWIQHKHFSCGSLKQIDFGWDFPDEEHKIAVAFQFIGPYRSKFNNDIITLNLDKMDKPQSVEFKGQNDELLVIEISIQIVGLRRTIIFQNRDQSQISHYSDDDLLLQMSGNKLGISFAEIGISIIGGKEHRSQIIYMSIKKLDLIMTEKQMKRNYQLKIKYINIDNNLNHNTMYPVLLTPLKYHKTLQKSRPFFICLIQQNLKTKQILEINYFRMCIQPISFKIYDEMLTRLYDFQTAFNVEEKEKKDVDVGILFRSRDQVHEWKDKVMVKEGASIFIREIQIGKVIVELSFSIRPTFSGNIIIYTIFALFKTALSNVSESQMKLNRFLCKNLSLGDVINQLSEFYRKQIFKEAYKIAGSINLLGNPYVFMKYLAEGTWQIVNQPSQGFIKGPIQGALGIGKGGVYFLRNVIAGTFNSFEVISQSCSRGLASITFDDKFITRREKIQMQKSKHVIQGTKSAMWALVTGFEVAISGIVRHPREERKKIGTAGIFKGLAIGIAGLVTKPMSGLFEAISKFSEGIKQTALFFQDGPNTTRSRPPRVFISNQQYYTQYHLEESKAINLLEFHSTKHLQKTILLVTVDEHLDDSIYTVLTSEYLVQLSKSNKKIIKQVKLSDINEVQPEQIGGKRGVRIKYHHEEMVIITQRHRELYECFKEIFTKIDEEYDDEEFYDDDMA